MENHLAHLDRLHRWHHPDSQPLLSEPTREETHNTDPIRLFLELCLFYVVQSDAFNFSNKTLMTTAQRRPPNTKAETDSQSEAFLWYSALR